MDPSSSVAAQTLPVPSGAINGSIADATVTGLLDFAGYMIKWALDTRLAEIQGPTTGSPVVDACPAANRYPYNPEMTQVRLPKPAIFAWWDGLSVVSPWTMIYGRRIRTIRMLYLFPEVVLPGGAAVRAGLPAIVDAVFAKMGRECAHPSYGYDGAAVGTPITQSLDLMHLEYTGGEQGMASEVPGNALAAEQRSGGGAAQRGFPFLRGVFTVWERVGVTTGEDPLDVMGDIAVTIETNEQGDLGDTMVLKEGYLLGADGSEAPSP